MGSAGRCGLRPFLLFSLLMADAHLVLTSVTVDGQPTQDGLRGGGDIWEPAIPGANQLRCGGFGNTDIAPARIPISAGQEVTVSIDVMHLARWPVSGGIKVEFDVGYGGSPNFQAACGEPMGPSKSLVVPAPVSVDNPWRVSVDTLMPNNPVNGPATIQVTLVEGPAANESFRQCIDVQVSGGTGDRPIPPACREGWTGVFFELVGRAIPTTRPGTGLAPQIWIMIALVVLVALCLMIYCCIKCKKEPKDISPLPSPAPREATPPPPPIPIVLPEPEPEPEPKKKPEHFHFQYLKQGLTAKRHTHFKYTDNSDAEEDSESSVTKGSRSERVELSLPANSKNERSDFKVQRPVVQDSGGDDDDIVSDEGEEEDSEVVVADAPKARTFDDLIYDEGDLDSSAELVNAHVKINIVDKKNEENKYDDPIWSTPSAEPKNRPEIIDRLQKRGAYVTSLQGR